MCAFHHFHSFVLVLGLVAVAGCGSVALTPDEVEPLLQKQFSKGNTAHFDCTDGEAGWAYICQARYEPTSAGRAAQKTTVERVGVKIMGTYQGSPAFATFPIPDGPTLSAEELVDYRKAQADEAGRKAREAMHRR
jgi:hypothetical protein